MRHRYRLTVTSISLFLQTMSRSLAGVNSKEFTTW